MTGEVLAGRYRIDGFLGRSDIGTAWRADDLRLRRTVAVKQLRAQPTHAWDTVRERACRAVCLTHPNVVTLHDAGVAEDRVFLVSELVDGPDLTELLAAEPGRRADPVLVAEIARQVSVALGAAHTAGLVHGHLKPGNVLLTLDGTVKVGDLGIGGGVPHPGAPPSAAFYLSPEEVRGQTASEAGDWYALGCVLYELLAGRPPFVGDSVEEVLDQHLHAAAVPIQAVRPDAGPRLTTLVTGLLAKDPVQRLRSIVTFHNG